MAVMELKAAPARFPAIFIDLKGVQVSRQGSVSILQIYLASANETFLFDVHTLGRHVFDTAMKGGSTLKSLLESTVILKVAFDVRNDSDALCSLFDINLAGVSGSLQRCCAKLMVTALLRDQMTGFRTETTLKVTVLRSAGHVN